VPSHTVIGNRHLIAKGWQLVDEKVWYQLPIAELTFLIVIFHFSLVKVAMNAPHLCKLCKDCLTGIGHGAMVLTKRLHFFIFQLLKVETKTIAHLLFVEGLSFQNLNRCIQNCKLRNEKKINHC
jgi:hypothetical protein